MSVFSGLRCQHEIAAIICCSGYSLFTKKELKPVSKSQNAKTHIFMFHAVRDSVVPTDHAKQGFSSLQKIGCNIE